MTSRRYHDESWGQYYSGGIGPGNGSPLTKFRPVFRREAIAGHHLFCTVPFQNRFFVTDVLCDALKQACSGGIVFVMENDVV